MLNVRKENPMAIRSKNALSEALLSLMLTRPFGEISICDVAHRARLARQTFYTNFERKEDILRYLLQGLFQRYYDRLAASPPEPENLLIEYFLFWGGSRDFLTLLMRQRLGALFQDANRAFFIEDTDILNHIFRAEPWQLPYIKAGVAGITYELLTMWFTKDEGLSVEVLNTLARNLLSGSLFVSPAVSQDVSPL